jgi:hypothetical protein
VLIFEQLAERPRVIFQTGGFEQAGETYRGRVMDTEPDKGKGPELPTLGRISLTIGGICILAAVVAPLQLFIWAMFSALGFLAGLCGVLINVTRGRESSLCLLGTLVCGFFAIPIFLMKMGFL